MRRHVVFLALFSVAIVCVWMLPVQMAGFPFRLSAFVPDAIKLLDTGILSSASGRLPRVFFSWLLAIVDPAQVNTWVFITACFFAAGLWPWWLTVRRIFNEQVAWVSVVVISLMPMYWVEILYGSGYSFAVPFLFAAIAAFVLLCDTHRIFALILSGALFGCTLASLDAFTTFIPWIVLAYIWVNRIKWKQAIVHVALFLGIAYVGYVAPLLTNAISMDGSIAERVAVFYPSTQNGTAPTGHLYPDDYTYKHDKEVYDQIIKERSSEASFIVRQQDANYRAMHGIGDVQILDFAINRLWLVVNSLPTYFLTETVGGAFIWIFILIGMVVMHRRDKTLLYLLGSLWLCMEFMVRIVIGFSRDHSTDVGFILALLAAVGVVELARLLAKKKGISNVAICTLITVLIAGQLIQENRKYFARLYERSTVLESYAAAEALKDMPTSAVLGYPRKPHLLYFTQLEREMVHNDTIDRLSIKQLKEPFDIYGITHVIGYTAERMQKIQAAVPDVTVITLQEYSSPVPINHLMRYLLHLVR